jgi:uncharacterized protein (DUF4415 family)
MRKRHRDADSPPASDEMLAKLQSLSKAPARLQDAVRRFRGPQKAPTKKMVSLRLSQETLERYRKTGHGWMTRMSADLDKAAKKLPV